MQTRSWRCLTVSLASSQLYLSLTRSLTRNARLHCCHTALQALCRKGRHGSRHWAGPRTGDALTLAHGQRVLQVEHGLLPVRVACAGAGAEADGLVAAAELDVEVADQSVHEVVAAGC